MKGIILNNIKEAEALNHREAIRRGCTGTTQYWFSTRELTATSELPKEQYAELFGISETITNENGEEVANSEYTDLAEVVEVKKHALVTDGNIIETDEEGNETVYESVDISDLLPVVNEE
jgi:hypothetical protein